MTPAAPPICHPARRRALGTARSGDQRGIATLELVVWAPILLIVLGVVVVGGRIANTNLELQAAARAAARAASLQRSNPAAVAAATTAARSDLTAAGVTCRHYQLTLTLGPPGGVDHAHLTCVVPLAGAGLVGVGASKTMTADFSSPVDIFRAETGGP